MLEQKLINILLQYFLLPLIVSSLLTYTLSSLFAEKYIRTLLGGLIVSLILYVGYHFLGSFEMLFYSSFAILELLYLFYGLIASKSEVTTSSLFLLITSILMVLAFTGYIPKFWIIKNHIQGR